MVATVMVELVTIRLLAPCTKSDESIRINLIVFCENCLPAAIDGLIAAACYGSGSLLLMAQGREHA
jgi:hypothetical protein